MAINTRREIDIDDTDVINMSGGTLTVSLSELSLSAPSLQRRHPTAADQTSNSAYDNTRPCVFSFEGLSVLSSNLLRLDVLPLSTACRGIIAAGTVADTAAC